MVKLIHSHSLQVLVLLAVNWQMINCLNHACLCLTSLPLQYITGHKGIAKLEALSVLMLHAPSNRPRPF